MTLSDLPLERGPGAGEAAPPRGLARRLVLAALDRIEDGQLTLHEGGSRWCFGHPSRSLPHPAELQVGDPDFWRALMLDGTLGAAESWIRGGWSSPDLTSVLRVVLRNQTAMSQLDRPWTRLAGGTARRVWHMLRRNNRAGARRNIHAHYDMGNELFELFLDPTLTYSCALFETEEMSLEQASRAKYDRLCRRLRIGPADHVLEIGTGWGGFALHAASRYGCRVTTTTISDQQHALARERIERAGLSERIRLLKEDYRDLTGTYDKLVSIEMIEAVGHQYFDTYLRTCARRLTPDGIFGLQAITILDQRYEEAARSVDFIKRYIFPGGDLPSPSVLADVARRATDFRICELVDLTPHYVRTLQEWRDRFEKRLDDVYALGYDDAFVRTWLYYLAYCEAGFLERNIGCHQILFARPECRLGSI